MDSHTEKQAMALILKNIALFEDATNFTHNLDQRIFEEVDKLVKATISEWHDWEGVFNFYDDECIFTTSNNLAKSEHVDSKSFDNNSTANYWLACYDDEDNNYFISGLFLEKSGMCFKFGINYHHEEFPFRGKREWKKFALEQNNNFPMISQNGFEFDNNDGRWYLPIEKLDISTVIECYEQDCLEDALEPFRKALEVIKHTPPYFEKIINAAKEYTL